MSKIEIKTSYPSLKAICQTIDDAQFNAIRTPEQKAVYSIMDQVMNKLWKKVIDKRESQKEFKVSFKYYEAFAFEKMCRAVYQAGGDIYETNCALRVANEIEKQL